MEIKIHDRYSVSIDSNSYSFIYMNPDHYLKEEYKGQYQNFGGLQCQYEEGSEEFKTLYVNLIKMAKLVIEIEYEKQ